MSRANFSKYLYSCSQHNADEIMDYIESLEKRQQEIWERVCTKGFVNKEYTDLIVTLPEVKWAIFGDK